MPIIREIAAHWNGSQLVSDEKSPQGGKMSRTFELSKDGRQVYETISIERGKNRGSLSVRYVYDTARFEQSAERSRFRSGPARDEKAF